METIPTGFPACGPGHHDEKHMATAAAGVLRAERGGHWTAEPCILGNGWHARPVPARIRRARHNQRRRRELYA